MNAEDCRQFVDIVLDQNSDAKSFSLHLPDLGIANEILAEFERRGIPTKHDVGSGKVTVVRWSGTRR
jgi:hypothetical protein